jgi:formylglycine-generating enzyme required for sulfatase activity
MLGLIPVPPSFRALDPSIPADSVIAANAAALCPGQGCAPDAVAVGPLCMDKYEASVWQVPAGPSNAGLITKIKLGTVALADLTAGGATQISPSSSCTPGFPATFPDTGQWTQPLYAVSIAGVHPTGCGSWFQAAQACRLAGKRLPTNAEWQDAAAGTPDPGDLDDGSTTCNTDSAAVANTGSRGGCESSWGVFDMVGNVAEWVADWGPQADGCAYWHTELGFTDGDYSCMGNLGSTSSFFHIPGALFRGGAWGNGSGAGVFTVNGSFPSDSDFDLGFRCAR